MRREGVSTHFCVKGEKSMGRRGGLGWWDRVRGHGGAERADQQRATKMLKGLEHLC